MNVIPCTTWVRRGVAATIPEKVELTPHELEKIIKQTHSDLQDYDEESDSEECKVQLNTDKKNTGESSTTSNDEYNFDAYDDESGNMHCHIANIASFGADGRDPLITNDEEDSEKEDDIIKSDDNLVLIGHVEKDTSILEIFVYNEREGSFYCHHDILLPSFPLCIEWLNYDSADSKPGNLCAIGNMTPIIEVWDLDMVDCLEPAYKLGCKPSKKRKQKRVGHRDAVLDVAWNQNYTHVLASGSVDQTVLLWDLDNCKPVIKFEQFNGKIQALKWHPQETHQLLTGCADKCVRLLDCKQEKIVKSWSILGEVERILWNHYDPNYCIASTDSGYIEYLDVRAHKPIWQIKAHEKEITGLSLSTIYQGLLVSCSNDGVIKIWDIIDNRHSMLVWEKKSNLGAIQCLAPNPDNGYVFAAGGDNKSKNFQILDLSEISSVREKFGDARRIASHNVVPSSSITIPNHEEIMDVTEDMESISFKAESLNMQKKKNRKV